MANFPQIKKRMKKAAVITYSISRRCLHQRSLYSILKKASPRLPSKLSQQNAPQSELGPELERAGSIDQRSNEAPIERFDKLSPSIPNSVTKKKPTPSTTLESLKSRYNKSPTEIYLYQFGLKLDHSIPSLYAIPPEHRSTLKTWPEATLQEYQEQCAALETENLAWLQHQTLDDMHAPISTTREEADECTRMIEMNRTHFEREKEVNRLCKVALAAPSSELKCIATRWVVAELLHRTRLVIHQLEHYCDVKMRTLDKYHKGTDDYYKGSGDWLDFSTIQKFDRAIKEGWVNEKWTAEEKRIYQTRADYLTARELVRERKRHLEDVWETRMNILDIRMHEPLDPEEIRVYIECVEKSWSDTKTRERCPNFHPGPRVPFEAQETHVTTV